MNEYDQTFKNGIELYERTSGAEDRDLLELFRLCNDGVCTPPETVRKFLFGFWFACAGNAIKGKLDELRTLVASNTSFRKAVDLLELKYVSYRYHDVPKIELDKLDWELSLLERDVRTHRTELQN